MYVEHFRQAEVQGEKINKKSGDECMFLWIEKIYVEYDTEIEVVTWKNRKEFVNKRGKIEELMGGKKECNL